MFTLNNVRSKFLDFFAKNGHEVVSSSPLVPHNDPSLMFTNAGMVQFKNVFTQAEKRPYSTATSSQKCVRAGGKHNDLDNVGYTARHHTFFEMLGNFSFGDYFKEQSIKLAWELLTKEFGIPEEKLLVTVYHTDEEALKLWKKIASLPESKIIKIATKDNFWAMGDTGPCGPCSEIFYDHGENIPGGPPGSKDEDGDRFIEIWNLVFMQHEKLSGGKQIDLPAPSIDTGMGLERMAAVLQGVHDNYDVDLFQSLITASKDISGDNKKENHNSHRVIADHLRSSSFLIADGVMPSNEGRGYVLRRIMRRAMRHARQIGCKDPLMYKLVPSLVKEMGDTYPELLRAESLITEMLKLEEEKFSQTLDRGIKLLESETKSIKSGGNLSGQVAFKLYDTYGFPLDLTTDILRNRNIEVDEKGFATEMQKQKERAKASWKGSGEKGTEEVWFEIKDRIENTEFLGYTTNTASANIVAIIKDGKETEQAKSGDEVQLILNQTPFYGESGGQQGDTGTISSAETIFEVTDTLKMLGNITTHLGKIKKGGLKVGDEVKADINNDRRLKLRSNHSATHLLHTALKQVLGNHVTQKGSLVAEDRLRFDISHPKAVSFDELKQVESIVNEQIRNNTKVTTQLMQSDEAIKAGALALFGEKYGDEVRVLTMGLDKFSVELCGGTHVNRTGDIGFFKIISENAIAAGVRRIEAITGDEAIKYTQKQFENEIKISTLLKCSADDIENRLNSLFDEKKKLEKHVTDLRKQSALGGSNGNEIAAEKISGIDVVAKNFGELAAKDLRNVTTQLKQKFKSAIIVAGSSCEGKGSVIITIGDNATDRIKATDLIKHAATALGAAGGGGKDNFAQTGGPNGEQVDKALLAVKDIIAKS